MQNIVFFWRGANIYIYTRTLHPIYIPYIICLYIPRYIFPKTASARASAWTPRWFWPTGDDGSREDEEVWGFHVSSVQNPLVVDDSNGDLSIIYRGLTINMGYEWMKLINDGWLMISSGIILPNLLGILIIQ